MRQYIIRRLLLMPITLIGITFVVFCLTRMVPGGPVERILQEQAIGALAGEKTVGQVGSRLGNDDLERLEELFNLQEPAWKAYLQWLGVLPREVEIAKAEFNDEGKATITIASTSGNATACIRDALGVCACFALNVILNYECNCRNTYCTAWDCFCPYLQPTGRSAWQSASALPMLRKLPPWKRRLPAAAGVWWPVAVHSRACCRGIWGSPINTASPWWT